MTDKERQMGLLESFLEKEILVTYREGFEDGFNALKTVLGKMLDGFDIEEIINDAEKKRRNEGNSP